MSTHHAATAARHGRRIATAAALVGTLGTLACTAALAQSPPVYTVTPLPLSGVTAFNDKGQILGRAFFPCTSGFCALSDQPALLDTASGALTAPGGGLASTYTAINASGQLAGARIGYDANGQIVRSVVIRQPDGSVTTVPAPALPATAATGFQVRGFNRNGQVALAYSDGLDASAPMCGHYAGWLGTIAGAWQALGAAGTTVWLSGLNAHGRAVGAAVPSAGCSGAGIGFRAMAATPDGATVDLHGALPGAFSRARAINDFGYAVGEYDSGLRSAPDAYAPQGMPITRAVVWNTATRTSTDVGPAGATSRLNGVNNRGEMVGTARGPVSPSLPITGSGSYAVLGNLATTAPMVDLNTLLAHNTAGWRLHDAVAINAAGQIVASGYNAANASGYVLLTPVTAPYDPYAVLPSAPASLMSTLASGQAVQLAWVNTARNATRVVVERCRGSTCRDFAAIATLAGDAGSHLDAGLARRTTYRYRVRAGNAAGLSAPGNVATITTLR